MNMICWMNMNIDDDGGTSDIKMIKKLIRGVEHGPHNGGPGKSTWSYRYLPNSVHIFHNMPYR